LLIGALFAKQEQAGESRRERPDHIVESGAIRNEVRNERLRIQKLPGDMAARRWVALTARLETPSDITSLGFPPAPISYVSGC
jgi:hypothetical protein